MFFVLKIRCLERCLRTVLAVTRLRHCCPRLGMGVCIDHLGLTEIEVNSELALSSCAW